MTSFMRPNENRRKNNSNFQTRLEDARRTDLHTSLNMVDKDRSSEEPPTKFEIAMFFLSIVTSKF